VSRPDLLAQAEARATNTGDTGDTGDTGLDTAPPVFDTFGTGSPAIARATAQTSEITNAAQLERQRRAEILRAARDRWNSIRDEVGPALNASSTSERFLERRPLALAQQDSSFYELEEDQQDQRFREYEAQALDELLTAATAGAWSRPVILPPGQAEEALSVMDALKPATRARVDPDSGETLIEQQSPASYVLDMLSVLELAPVATGLPTELLRPVMGGEGSKSRGETPIQLATRSLAESARASNLEAMGASPGAVEQSRDEADLLAQRGKQEFTRSLAARRSLQDAAGETSLGERYPGSAAVIGLGGGLLTPDPVTPALRAGKAAAKAAGAARTAAAESRLSGAADALARNATDPARAYDEAADIAPTVAEDFARVALRDARAAPQELPTSGAQLSGALQAAPRPGASRSAAATMQQRITTPGEARDALVSAERSRDIVGRLSKMITDSAPAQTLGRVFDVESPLYGLARGYREIVRTHNAAQSRVAQDIQELAEQADDPTIYSYLTAPEQTAGMANVLPTLGLSPWQGYAQAVLRKVAAPDSPVALVRAVAGAPASSEVAADIARTVVVPALRRGDDLEQIVGKVASELAARNLEAAPGAAARVANVVMGEAVLLDKLGELHGSGLVPHAQHARAIAADLAGTAGRGTTGHARVAAARYGEGARPVPIATGPQDRRARRIADQLLPASVQQSRKLLAAIDNGAIPRRVRDALRQRLTQSMPNPSRGPMNWARAAVSTYKRAITSGIGFDRPTYRLSNYINDCEQIFQVAGFRVAARHALKQGAHLGASLALSGLASANAAKTADMLGRPGALAGTAAFNIAAQRVSPDVSRGLDALIRPDLNRVMDGTDDVIAGQYTGKQLNQLGAELGVFETFVSSELARSLQPDRTIWGGLFKRLGDAEEAFGARASIEDFQTRTKVGLWVDLINDGMDPRQAAAVANEALLDFSKGLTDTERRWLADLFMPFWAWQKLNHALSWRSLFSPNGSYAAAMKGIRGLYTGSTARTLRLETIRRNIETFSERNAGYEPGDLVLAPSWARERLKVILPEVEAAYLQELEDRDEEDYVNEVLILPESPLHAALTQVMGAVAWGASLFEHSISSTEAFKPVAEVARTPAVEAVVSGATGIDPETGRALRGDTLSQALGVHFWQAGMAERRPKGERWQYRILPQLQVVYDVLGKSFGLYSYDQALKRAEAVYDPTDPETTTLLTALGFQAKAVRQSFEAQLRQREAGERISAAIGSYMEDFDEAAYEVQPFYRDDPAEPDTVGR
jgi:hypothetical protein